MSLAVVRTPPAPMSAVPALAILDPDRRRGRPRRRRPRPALAPTSACHDRLLTTALADLSRALTSAESTGLSCAGSPARRDGGAATSAGGSADALQPELVRRDGWRFSLPHRRRRAVLRGRRGQRPRRRVPRAASSTSQPGTAPEVFARLVTTLDGYGIGLPRRAGRRPGRLPCARTAPSSPCARDDAPTVARVALRLQQRAPFALAPSVPAFARQIAPRGRARRRAGTRSPHSDGTAAAWSPQGSSRPAPGAEAGARGAPS